MEQFEIGPFALLMLSTVGVLLLHHYLFSARILLRFVRADCAEEAQAYSIFLQRLCGAGLLLALPIAMGHITGHRFHMPRLELIDFMPILILWLIIGTVIVPIIWWNSRRSAFHSSYPEVKTNSWTLKLHWVNALSWTAYLFSYEFLFRGFLLFGLVELVGTWPGILLATSVYVGAHVHKPAAEILGCIPIGIAFAYVAINSGTILGPFLGHLIIALSNDRFCLRYRRQTEQAGAEGTIGPQNT